MAQEISEMRRALRNIDPTGRKHGFHVAMSAETYQVLRKQYAAGVHPDAAAIYQTIWDDLWIAIDERCAYGVVDHRQGWRP